MSHWPEVVFPNIIQKSLSSASKSHSHVGDQKGQATNQDDQPAANKKGPQRVDESARLSSYNLRAQALVVLDTAQRLFTKGFEGEIRSGSMMETKSGLHRRRLHVDPQLPSIVLISNYYCDPMLTGGPSAKVVPENK